MTDSRSHPDHPIESILFVCLGNICRSPLAEGVLRHRARERGLEGELRIDSAGTGSWHVGNPPDPRSAEVAARHGIRLESRARQVAPGDAEAFDLILAMDRSNLRDLADLLDAGGGRGRQAEVRLFRDYDPEADSPADVPDPYYGAGDGFEVVQAMVERTCEAILDEVERRRG
ncbi:MAG: low molecular weight phosphotyrosine protein phosphatase [Gemmatimonadales bacterium]|nr:MAG: low molecular weight phosphotyrosine protein phosphatase [Gemmatimonadales bacterium]